MAESQLSMDCGAPGCDDSFLELLWVAACHEDYAARNLVWWNRFENLLCGIRIEDDST